MQIGYTGGMIERELFGETEKREGTPPLKRYLNFKQSLDVVKKSQINEDLSDPDRRFANDLHATVANRIGLDDYSRLKFYTAVNDDTKTHLDYYHGVDAFLELEREKEGIIRVTLDVTSNKSKSEEWKADVVFLWPSDGLDPKLPEDKEEYKRILEDVAQRVVNIIKENQ